MNTIHPSLPHLATDHPIVFAWFANRNAADLALTDMFAVGFTDQDFTLVEPLPASADPADESLEASLATTPGGSVVRAAPDESEVGGGIATSSANDDVSQVEEMDDSESAAEDLLYPRGGRSFGDEETAELDNAANHGFQTTEEETLPLRRAEIPYTEIDLPGLGRLIGEGSFGTALLEARYRGGIPAVRRWLWGENAKGIEGDGCVLALDITPNSPPLDELEASLQQAGAKLIQHMED